MNKLNEQEIIDIQVTMASIFRQINVLPLDDLIEKTDKALTFAPFFDPTLWINKQEDANRMLRIAKAFKACRDAINIEFGKGGD